MSATTPTLPHDWASFLDEIQDHLERAVQATDERLERLPAFDTAAQAESRLQDAERLQAALQGLSTQLGSAETLVQEVDQALHEAEDLLRQQNASCTKARERLTQWLDRVSSL